MAGSRADGVGLAYVLSTPDSVIAGHVGRTAAIMAAAGFEAVAHQIVALDTHTMLWIWERTREVPDRANFYTAAFDGLYAAGPGVVLVCRADEAGIALLKEVKGATDPSVAAPGTVRAAGFSPMLNLVHTPDDLETATEDLTLILGARAVANLAGPEPRPTCLSDLSHLERSLPRFSGPTALAYAEVISRIAARTASRLALEMSGCCDIGRVARLVEVLAATRARDDADLVCLVSEVPGRSAGLCGSDNHAAELEVVLRPLDRALRAREGIPPDPAPGQPSPVCTSLLEAVVLACEAQVSASTWVLPTSSSGSDE